MPVSAVLLGVVAARLGMVMRGVGGVTMRGMRVMGGLLVVAALVVLGGLAMMLRRLLVMLGGLVVVLGSLMGHGRVSCRTAQSRTLRSCASRSLCPLCDGPVTADRFTLMTEITVSILISP